jgi:CRISPR-associated endonuclease/helicase Cas3
MFYAHSNDSGKQDWQPLLEHLNNTSQLAEILSAGTNLTEFAKLAACLHDAGKYSLEFQERLSGKRGPVDHSTAGAQLIMDISKEDKFQQFKAAILAYCISGHHAGLPDYGSPDDHPTAGTLLARLKRPVNDCSHFFDDFSRELLQVPRSIPVRPLRKRGQFSVSFFIRMVFSILVDADFLETERFVKGQQLRGGYPSIQALQERMSQFIQKFADPVSAINCKRTEILNACLSQADSSQGLYSLTIPTGGGKTYTSLALALSHAKKYELKRVIYCIPFTSIIEQNAQVFKDCIGADCVLEHHSNFDWNEAPESTRADDSTNAAVKKLKLASENWDIPIVVTTNVQLFESVFANRSSRCRKLHALANSVIIFDEVQMLPRSYLEPCMMAVAELIKNYGATVLFCTATQPPLERFFPQDIRPIELISEPDQLYNFFKRVTVVDLGQQTDTAILEKINDDSQVLCIVNTRRHAKGLYESILDTGDCFHLSTLMCPEHRKVVLKEVRERLTAGKPCKVISTQLMEAGIDVDFPTGYRALAGLDSIVQAAGRVNREGGREEAVLYVFQPETEYIKRVPAYIAQTAAVARIILEQYDDPISIQALSAYYELLYDLQDSQAFDQKNIMGCFEKDILDQPNFDFKTAAERFRMIEAETVPVIIPWNSHAEDLIQKLRYTDFPNALQRPLQTYTVNIYPNEFDALKRAGRIEIYHERFAVLKHLEEGYSNRTGLAIPEDAEGEAIFI